MRRSALALSLVALHCDGPAASRDEADGRVAFNGYLPGGDLRMAYWMGRYLRAR